ncbi:hypothetical protein ASPBRDRAFT_39501 [Aspergillus brasiliensis CBS 101740]|uniref:Uncharacterized protein n=1 Tax=Aspergillus brasiliensis (strain CBS 101740 / IMI 381727 / IBT 21946) TaxID=767769 RepID=A0A1L9URX4_ASPBC|nr:hypothetical protein ASPBRDRAFT_39501 [Aspergillus brasiliensis CBS 101740]
MSNISRGRLRWRDEHRAEGEFFVNNQLSRCDLYFNNGLPPFTETMAKIYYDEDDNIMDTQSFKGHFGKTDLEASSDKFKIEANLPTPFSQVIDIHGQALWS